MEEMLPDESTTTKDSKNLTSLKTTIHSKTTKEEHSRSHSKSNSNQDENATNANIR